MSTKNNKQSSGKFSPRDEGLFERKTSTKDQRKVNEDLPKISFSFKDFDIKQIPPGQSYDDWQKDKLLAYMLLKFGHICGLNIVEAQQQKVLKIYENFPSKSDFKHPPHIIKDVRWAVIMDIKGQKCRVGGHIIDNIFYVVFLDKEHRFYITEKRAT